MALNRPSICLTGANLAPAIVLFTRWRARGSGGGFGLLRLAAVTLEGPRRSELAKAMTNHVFRHEHFQVRFAVVDHKGQADKLGHDRASPRPSLDRLFRAGLLRSLHLLEHLEI